jgi:hypothetical protein
MDGYLSDEELCRREAMDEKARRRADNEATKKKKADAFASLSPEDQIREKRRLEQLDAAALAYKILEHDTFILWDEALKVKDVGIAAFKRTALNKKALRSDFNACVKQLQTENAAKKEKKMEAEKERVEAEKKRWWEARLATESNKVGTKLQTE